MPEPLIAKLQTLVNDPHIRFEIEPGAGENAPSSSLGSDLYDSISRVSNQQFPGAKVLPYMSPWATDSMDLRLRNVQAYGLVPFPLSSDDISRMHGNDERIPLESFREGLEYISAILTDFATAK
jgi:acetylornithine deacetylase/succinyl-diaminopimelate desuccinylase-like protein